MTAPLSVSVDRLGPGASGRIERILGAAVPAVAPALSLSVWSQGSTTLEASAGWLDPPARAQAVEPGVRWDLASITKLFCATAFLRLVAEGRVDLDDAVVAVIPEFGSVAPRSVDGGQEPLSRRMLPVTPERAHWRIDPGTVTFRQLLSHTSGLAPWRAIFRETGPVPPPPDEADPVPREERWRSGLALLFGAPFIDRPGSAIHYSDLGFITLAEAVRRLAGTPLEDVIRGGLAAPLGLDSLTFRPVSSGTPRTAIVPTSLDDDWRGRRCWGEVEDENAAGLGGVSGHAGLFATARDVAAFGVAWLTRDARLGLTDEVARSAVRDQSAGAAGARGLGWQIQDRSAPYLVPFGADAHGHTGFTGTSLAVDPSRQLVVALLTNRVHASRTNAGIESLRLAVHEAIVAALG